MHSEIPPVPPERQRVFQQLMGLPHYPNRLSGELLRDDLVRCPSLDHQTEGLTCKTDWQGGVFYCSGCGAGGGIEALGRLLGVGIQEAPSGSRTPPPPIEPPSPEDHERHRLIRARLWASLSDRREGDARHGST